MLSTEFRSVKTHLSELKRDTSPALLTRIALRSAAPRRSKVEGRTHLADRAQPRVLVDVLGGITYADIPCVVGLSDQRREGGDLAVDKAVCDEASGALG